MHKSLKLFIEALIVGIITIIVYILLELILKIFTRRRYKIFLLFLTGFLIHLGCQFTGINLWYCHHGVACMTDNKNNLNFEYIHPASIQ